MKASLHTHATAVMTAETTALRAIKSALDKFDAALTAATKDLNYPANFRSDAVRIVRDVKAGYVWRMTELDTLLASFDDEKPQA